MNKVSAWIDRIKKRAVCFANSNGFIKFVLTLIVWAIAFIPVYIASLFFWLLGPVGFWQTFATFAACVVVLGIPQIILMCLGVAFTIALISID